MQKQSDMENYEQKYKSLVARIKNAYLYAQTNSTRAVLEDCLPELKESEDERIRKFLVKHVSEWIGCIEHDLKISSKDVESEEELAMFKAGLAYLEKQRESTWTEEDDIFERNILPRILNPSSWTLDQNNADKHYLEEFVDRQKNKSFEKQKEQKPAEWSEEDKEMLFFLNEFMDNKGKDYFSTLVYPKIKIWLKSLYERFNLEPKQKWSEEDENVIKNLIELVEGESYNNFYESSKDTILKWLESLRPHPHWKPSEEQMDALERAIVKMHTVDDIGVLAELRDNLKKL